MMDVDKDHEMVMSRLADEGILCRDLYALEKDPEALQKAGPLLIGLFSQISSFRVKRDLLRAVLRSSVPPQRLVEELRNAVLEVESGDRDACSFAWTLGDSLARTANLSVFDDLVELVRDIRFGSTRGMLPHALARIKARREEVVETLLGILNDKDVAPQAMDALGRMKATEAISAIREHVDSADRLTRSEARKTLKKLDNPAGEKPPVANGPLVKPLPSAVEADVAETSANFDVDEVSTMLYNVSAFLTGFGDTEIGRIESRLKDMAPNQEEEFVFPIRFLRKRAILRINVYLSDGGAADVGFFSDPSIVEAIDEKLREL